MGAHYSAEGCHAIVVEVIDKAPVQADIELAAGRQIQECGKMGVQQLGVDAPVDALRQRQLARMQSADMQCAAKLAEKTDRCTAGWAEVEHSQPIVRGCCERIDHFR